MAKTLVELTAIKLLELIDKRGYEVGDKIPNEFELAEDLEVGRSTLREAVRSLATRNILEVRQGSGTFISEKKGIIKDPLGFSFVEDKDKLLEDLFEFRILIEPRIAELVALRATDEEIEELEDLVEKIEKMIKAKNHKNTLLDIEFHSKLATMSRNIAYKNIIPTITESIALISSSYSSDHMRQETIEMHRNIIDAIKRRDHVTARDAMYVHTTLVKLEAIKNKNKRRNK